jgi:hypothetical protein
MSVVYDKSIILSVAATHFNVCVHRGNQPSFWLLEIRLLVQEMYMSINIIFWGNDEFPFRQISDAHMCPFFRGDHAEIFFEMCRSFSNNLIPVLTYTGHGSKTSCVHEDSGGTYVSK